MSQRVAHGDGLYLVNDRSWVFMYKFKGKRIERGLGPIKKVSLAQAKKVARANRVKLDNGIDPYAVVIETSTPTFSAVATELIESLRPGWKNKKHGAQWESTLRTHAKALWDMPVGDITTEDVLKVLNPIWMKVPETATRVRGRIERVLDAAKVRGMRQGDNPARWKGHLEVLLPKRKPSSVKHHAAIPYEDLPDFVRLLQGRKIASAYALEFLILTAARTSEVINARIEEFDLAEGVWAIPEGRMKAGKTHRVPLTGRAIEIVRHMAFLNHELPFTMSNAAMDRLLDRMDFGEFTVHGFRSSFRDWAGDKTDFPREVIEQALAHQVGSEVERAYRRGDALSKRRELMQAWADYISPSSRS